MYKIIDEKDRMEFLPKHFKTQMITVESRVFTFAIRMINNYVAGEWLYAETENEYPFMFLNTEKTEISDPWGGETYLMDGDLAGLVVTSYAINSAILIAEGTGSRSIDHLIPTYCGLIKDGRALALNKNQANAFSHLID